MKRGDMCRNGSMRLPASSQPFVRHGLLYFQHGDRMENHGDHGASRQIGIASGFATIIHCSPGARFSAAHRESRSVLSVVLHASSVCNESALPRGTSAAPGATAERTACTAAGRNRPPEQTTASTRRTSALVFSLTFLSN